MIYFLSFSVLLVLLMNMISSNILIWWSGFLLMTLIFVVLNKSLYCYSSLLNYFIIQEVLGLFFLVSNLSVLQFFVLLMKTGVSPLHFWIFSVTNSLYGWGVMWFLTFQKMPFFPVLLSLMSSGYFYFIILGVVFCYLQLLIMKNYKNLIIVSSTESFNWVLMLGFMSLVNSYFLFFYYVILMIFLLPYFTNMSSNSTSWLLVLVFLNMPFTFTFFIKLISLSLLLGYSGLVFLLILFMMFLSMLSFSFFLVNMSVLNFLYLQGTLKMSGFALLPLMMLVLI
uniref:NADH dehydrogenase subunit 2 n=1 Tax=Steinernema litorale TaxID=361181 RepID=A0A1E1G7E3_9BILA|nr:NADH dehydrogenase subunit 2 [Steinernema litorale]